MKQHLRLSLRTASVAATLLVAAPPLAAQHHSATTVDQPKPDKQAGRVVTVPGYGTVYVVAQLPKDTRTPRQRCIDEEVEREGGSPSELAMGVIDLKCSQR